MNFEGDSLEKELMKSCMFDHLIDVEFEGYTSKPLPIMTNI